MNGHLKKISKFLNEVYDHFKTQIAEKGENKVKRMERTI